MPAESIDRTRMPNRRSSIYESPRGSGKWHGWVWLGIKEDGTPDRRHRRGPSRAEVTAAVRKLERDRDAGKVGRAGFSRVTVAQWGQQWLQIVADRGRADSTIARYRTDLDMYINPRIGPIRLSALAGDDIEAVLAQMRTDPLATVLPPSAADRSRLPAERPTDDEWSQPGDVRIHPRERPSRALTNQSVRALLEAARQDPDALARWAIAVLCGLRQGEALGLQWGRVNWDQGTLRIDRQLRRVRARHGCGDPTPRTGSAQKVATQPVPEDGGPRRRRLQQRDWPCGFRRPSDCPQRS